MSTPEKEPSPDLTAARNEISTQGEQISRLLASNKEWQEKYAHQGNNLTAMIDEALQKSKRLDSIEKEMGDYRSALEKVRDDPNKHETIRKFIERVLAKYSS